MHLHIPLMLSSVLIWQTCASEPVGSPTLVLSSLGELDHADVIMKREHDNLTLNCELLGDPNPREYVWTYAADNAAPEGERPFRIEPAVDTGGSKLLKTDLLVSDSGNYTCSTPPFSATKYILVTAGIIADMENTALLDDQHALDVCRFIHSTIYYTSAASALLFMAAVALFVFTMCKMRTRRTTRGPYNNFQYHQLQHNTMDVKMPTVHPTEMLRQQCERTDARPGWLGAFQLSMPLFGRSDAQTHTGNITNLTGSVKPPPYTDMVKASQDRDHKEADSHYKMAPSYVSLSTKGAVDNGYEMVDNRNVGDTNVYNGTNDVAYGELNIFNGNDNMIYGSRNVINGSNCTVTGNDNVVTGSHSQIFGDQNVNNGDSNTLHGHGVVINGHNDDIHANNRVINGCNIVVKGSDTDMSSTTSAVLAKNIVYGNNDQAKRDNINNDNVNNSVSNLVVGNAIVNKGNDGICDGNRAVYKSNNLGDSNVYNGTNDIAHGEHNVFNGNNSTIFGNSNVINGDNNTLHGNNVVINGHDNSIHANNRVINGNNIVINDLDNDMSNTTSVVIAKDDVSGNINKDNVNNVVANLVFGNAVVNKGNDAISNENRAMYKNNNIGDSNVYNGTNDIAHGEHNVFNGNNSTIFGNSNVINGDNNTLHGNNVVINGHDNSIHANNRVINGNNIVINDLDNDMSSTTSAAIAKDGVSDNINNVNNAVANLVSGNGMVNSENEATRTENQLIGYKNNVGDTNVYNGTNDVAHGNGNVFNGNDSVIYGDGNVINGNDCHVTGNVNVINGNGNIHHGNHVVINGHNNNIHANDRVINGDNIVIYDLDNDMSSTTTAVVATDNVYGKNDQTISDNINNDNVNSNFGNVVVGNRLVNANETICNENRAIDNRNVGDTNVYNGTNDVAHGEHNVFNGNDSVIYGNSNVINGNNDTLHGKIHISLPRDVRRKLLEL